jgi:hypothetical protein
MIARFVRGYVTKMAERHRGASRPVVFRGTIATLREEVLTMRRTSLWMAGLIAVAMVSSVGSARLLAAEDAESFRQASEAFSAALASGNGQAASALLDEKFQWVEANGKAHTKAEVLEDLHSFAADNEKPIDVRTLDLLGQVERVLGMHHDERFVHLWVKRPAGWQAFLFLDIPIPAERRDVLEPPKRPTDPQTTCDNPCNTLPYKPENAAQAGAMDAWFHLKKDEWHPNPEDWDAHADTFHETVTPRADIPKLQHVVELAEERKLYGDAGGSAGPPVQSMKMFDFGNVVIMEAQHAPAGATKPTTWVCRMFVNRGDGWKIVLSAQTSIK